MEHSAEHRAWLTRSAAFASIAIALTLAGLKGWATWRTGSTAMLGSLADTALDLVASVATLAGVWIAAMPADEEGEGPEQMEYEADHEPRFWPARAGRSRSLQFPAPRTQSVCPCLSWRCSISPRPTCAQVG